MKNNKKILILVLLLIIGFASVSTTLVVSGIIGISSKKNDFNVVFTSAEVGGNISSTATIGDDQKTITFNTDKLSIVGDTAEVIYKVKNKSTQYDANVNISCVGGDEEYLNVVNEFDGYTLPLEDLILMHAQEEKVGKMSVGLKKGSVDNQEIIITCTLNVEGEERESLVEESISKKVYGIRRSIDSANTTWERIESSVGLTANATKDGSEVENDFDLIYPWSDIITYNYDDITKTETSVYGQENFKFDGSNGQVLTRIPSFYYKRTVSDGYEYIYISEYEQSGYTLSEAFSVGRYTMSGDSTKVYSKSGVQPLVYKTITNFRDYANNIGNDFGQLDWRYFIIQMLYLVEYADYDSQEVLGLGNTNNSGAVASGGCNNLGMKSGSIVNDGKHSVIYRGIEDIFGNVWQFVDGINVKDNQAYINYKMSTYEVDKFDGDYQKIGYLNANREGYSISLGYDELHPLVSLPTSVGGDAQSYISDYYYWQTQGNRIALVGGRYGNEFVAGLWCWDFSVASSSAWTDIGARLLRTS